MKNFLCGVGVNDANYHVKTGSRDSRSVCPIYEKWSNMIKRCYSKSTQARQPAYKDCTVCPEWLTFSNFKAWMEQQDWQGKQLDKDVLIEGNKVYAPAFCVFVDSEVNHFLLDRASARGCYLLGVTWDSRRGKFQARISDFTTGNRPSLGYFHSEMQAHEAWRQRKHELACHLADMQTDARVANALRTRFETQLSQAA